MVLGCRQRLSEKFRLGSTSSESVFRLEKYNGFLFIFFSPCAIANTYYVWRYVMQRYFLKNNIGWHSLSSVSGFYRRNSRFLLSIISICPTWFVIWLYFPRITFYGFYKNATLMRRIYIVLTIFTKQIVSI